MTHPMQLDLFNDSGAIVYANEALAALSNLNAYHAAACIQHIIKEEPEYHGLDALQTLCQAVRDWPFPASTAMDVADSIRRLDSVVQPAVETLMRGEAKGFMHPYWLYLAKAPGSQVYDTVSPQSFCAYIYNRMGDNLSIAEAVESVPNWDDHSDLIFCLCLARYRIKGLDGCLSLIVRLAFLEPKRLPALINEIDDTQLRREWIAFKSEFDWLDPEGDSTGSWFPVWQLLEHSEMRIETEAVSTAAKKAQKVFELLSRLIKLEKRGLSKTLISGRSQLQKLDQNLFAAYMARRNAEHR